MANFNLSSNMNLPIPVPGVDPGPDYANNLNSSLTILDGHNHTSGSGVPIPTTGLNINSDLPINSNNVTLVRSIRFAPQLTTLSGASDLGVLFETGVDLYYRDGSGSVIRITQSGGIVGTPGSISGLTPPASVVYVPIQSTFIFQSDVNTAANLDAGFIILRNNTLNSKGLTLTPPAAMAANYTLTLPSIPGVTSVMTLDTSGNMSSVTFDQVGVNMTSTGANALAATRTRSTGTTVGIGGVAISNSCGSFNTSSTSYVSVTNLSVTLTTSGRPVQLALSADNNAVFGALVSGVDFLLRLSRNGTPISVWQGVDSNFALPPMTQIDVVAAGTYTYSMEAKSDIPGSVAVNFMVLTAYEL